MNRNVLLVLLAMSLLGNGVLLVMLLGRPDTPGGDAAPNYFSLIRPTLLEQAQASIGR